MLKYETKKLHKIIFYIVLKSEADVCMELENYDFAIKAHKSLKNYCKKWRQESLILRNYTKQESVYTKGTGDF